jgi:hypothetical protein
MSADRNNAFLEVIGDMSVSERIDDPMCLNFGRGNTGGCHGMPPKMPNGREILA